MEQYRDFAFVYDELMNEVDYNGWVKYIEDIIKNENAQVQNILELACGTGNLTIPLTKKNYDIAGIDISEEMLSVAREETIQQLLNGPDHRKEDEPILKEIMKRLKEEKENNKSN